MNIRWIAAPTLSLMLASGAAGQNARQALEEPKPEPKLVEAPELDMSYSDEEIARAAEMLTGCWKTSEPVKEFEGEGEANIVMTISPAKVAGLQDVLFVETAREDAIATPYRQSFFQFYRYKDGLRLRTLDLRSQNAAQALMGMSLVPDQFPATITAADAYPTIDIDLEVTPDGCSGESPAAYPDHRGGAVQMTSSISFDGETVRVSDVGYGADGDVAWEVGRDGGVEFERVDAMAEIARYDDGLVVIHFAEPEGEPIQEGDWMVIHYLGRLTDGTKFDASYDRGEPFRYKHPGALIPGWQRGTEGMTQGSRRRIIVPPALGYGERAVGPIPPNSTLIFDVECVFVEKGEPAGAQPGAAQPAESAPAEGE